MSQAYIDFAFVKENASFERILAHYNIDSRGSGVQRSIHCPFHKPDKRPSCRIEIDKKIFHCFACEASGNILEFVARMEGDADDLRGAALKIAGISEIALAPPRQNRKAAQRPPGHKPRRQTKAATADAAAAPENTPSKAATLTDRRVHGAIETTADPTAERPINAPLTFQLRLDPTHPYLAERGISAETIAEFGLGYCSRGVMAGRVCIPIHNAAGELVAYAGRWPGDELPEDIERYLLPKRFEKSHLLFNLHRVRDAEHVVLVEGYW